MRRRVDGLTVLQRVRAFVVANGGSVSRSELAVGMGVSREVAAGRIRRGVYAGILERPAKFRSADARYALTARLAPVDRRGTAPQSREALRLFWRPTPESLANLRNHAGTHPRPYVARLHPLERAWR